MINPKDTVQEALLKAKAKRVYLEGNLVKSAKPRTSKPGRSGLM